MKKCDGCGAVFQTLNPNQKGFIKQDIYKNDKDNKYCERCFNLIHYNRIVPIIMDDFDINKYLQIINKNDLIVNVIDIFDLEGSFDSKIREYFPFNPILFIANKRDLFLKSVKPRKVINYLESFLSNNNIKVSKILVLSANSLKDLGVLLKEIKELSINNKVYFFGMTNVGKSSLINGLIRFVGRDEGRIAVSNIIGTTLDLIQIELENNLKIIDMPGLINTNQVGTYLSAKSQKLLTQKHFIRPLVYQLQAEQTLFFGGLVILKFIKGKPSSFISYMPKNLKVHRTKLANTEKFYQDHIDDILKIPTFEERECLGKMKEHEFTFGKDKMDITISGLGFITLVGSGVIKLLCYEKIKVGYRQAII